MNLPSTHLSTRKPQHSRSEKLITFEIRELIWIKNFSIFSPKKVFSEARKTKIFSIYQKVWVATASKNVMLLLRVSRSCITPESKSKFRDSRKTVFALLNFAVFVKGHRSVCVSKVAFTSENACVLWNFKIMTQLQQTKKCNLSLRVKHFRSSLKFSCWDQLLSKRILNDDFRFGTKILKDSNSKTQFFKKCVTVTENITAK